MRSRQRLQTHLKRWTDLTGSRDRISMMRSSVRRLAAAAAAAAAASASDTRELSFLDPSSSSSLVQIRRDASGE